MKVQYMRRYQRNVRKTQSINGDIRAKGSVKQNQGPTNRNLLYSIGEIFFTNNISGGDIIYKIYFLWLIGKFVYNKNDCCENIIKKCSDFLSYYFGDSYSFSYDNILFMRKFYLYFPIYLEKYENIPWNYYVALLKINNEEITKLYLNICLFCNFDYNSLKRMIDGNLYLII